MNNNIEELKLYYTKIIANKNIEIQELKNQINEFKTNALSTEPEKKVFHTQEEILSELKTIIS